TAKSFLKFDEEIKVAALRAGERERSRMQVLAILKPSLDNSCHNCSHHNVNLARGLGYSDAQLAAIAAGTWRENDDFSEQEKVVLDWSDAVTHMSAARDQAAFDAMGEHFSHEEIVELTYTTALWNCTNRLAEALHLTAEPPGKGIDWGTD
ncbi:MAG: carboxymuconolactone decarboxylase family protein, partial [Rhodospirillaceae bacterium]|nr:carboxymuconolactone decarboxylase family protein [Rhodospirillaceae bacterium]